VEPLLIILILSFFFTNLTCRKQGNRAKAKGILKAAGWFCLNEKAKKPKPQPQVARWTRSPWTQEKAQAKIDLELVDSSIAIISLSGNSGRPPSNFHSQFQLDGDEIDLAPLHPFDPAPLHSFPPCVSVDSDLDWIPLQLQASLRLLWSIQPFTDDHLISFLAPGVLSSASSIPNPFHQVGHQNNSYPSGITPPDLFIVLMIILPS
jgi:hypothetical protein